MAGDSDDAGRGVEGEEEFAPVTALSSPPRPLPRLGLKRVSARTVGAGSGTVELDPEDAGIEEAIQRIERKSFLRDGVIPEIQSLLVLPPQQAKEAFLSLMANYSLVAMLILASLLGSALDPLDPDAYPDAPKCVAAFNMMAMIISCANLFATCVFVLESVIVESTPAERIHSVIARADGVFGFGVNMVATGLQGLAPLILVRAWVSGLDDVQCVVLTVVVALLYMMMMDTYFVHYQAVSPFQALRWVKLFAMHRYQAGPAHAAVDGLVAELRHLQQKRDKTLTPEQLGQSLGKFFSNADVLLADEAVFLRSLEADAGGRLAPTMEKLARQAFTKVADRELEKIAEAAADTATSAMQS